MFFFFFFVLVLNGVVIVGSLGWRQQSQGGTAAARQTDGRLPTAIRLVLDRLEQLDGRQLMATVAQVRRHDRRARVVPARRDSLNNVRLADAVEDLGRRQRSAGHQNGRRRRIATAEHRLVFRFVFLIVGGADVVGRLAAAPAPLSAGRRIREQQP